MSDAYTFEDVPGHRMAVAVFTARDGSRHVLKAYHTGTATGERNLRGIANAHRSAIRSVAGAAVALRFLPEVEAYLKGLDEDRGRYAGVMNDTRFMDEEEVSEARAEVVRHLAEALSESDPYRIARSYERDAQASLDMGFVRICERMSAEVDLAATDPAHGAVAAARLAGRIRHDGLHYSRAADAWRAAQAEPEHGPAPGPR